MTDAAKSITRFKTAAGAIVCAWDRIDGRMQMAWWLIPSGGGERRCLGLTDDMTIEDAARVLVLA